MTTNVRITTVTKYWRDQDCWCNIVVSQQHKEEEQSKNIATKIEVEDTWCIALTAKGGFRRRRQQLSVDVGSTLISGFESPWPLQCTKQVEY